MLKVLNKKLKKNNKGFTLVELLVVIAIIGILAAFAVPSLLKNVEKSKVGALETDFGTIKTSVMAYYSDTGKYPANITGLTTDPGATVATGWAGPYMDSIPGKTPFGGAYTLSSDGKTLIITANVSKDSFKKLKADLGASIVKGFTGDTGGTSDDGDTTDKTKVTITIAQ